MVHDAVAPRTRERAPPAVKVLFLMAHPGYSRNFESTLRELAEAGHEVVVAFDRRKEGAGGADDIIRWLTRRYPRITVVDAPVRKKRDALTMAATQVRATIDYLRYLEPRFRDAHKLRRRAAVQVPEGVRRVVGLPLIRTRAGRAALAALLRAVDRSIPARGEVRRFVRQQRPDLVLLTPLLEVGSPQVEYIRAAHDVGIRTGLCVASWDNLTTAGLIHEVPGLVTVWNEYQKAEAVELHGIPADRVVVTGACAYDHWFDWSASSTREEFCARIGIRPDLPYLLYTCSSGFITPGEDDFIVRWVDQVRKRHDLREVGIVIRPHPTNSIDGGKKGGSLAERLERFENVAVWPRTSVNPTTREARSVYYDSVVHAAAVVGINTSAFIESAILGRQTYTLLAPEYRDTQEGTPHFHHLLSVNGGLLHVAATFDEHARQLADAIARPPGSRDDLRPFLEGFVRPFGLDEPATPRMLRAFDELAARRAPGPWREAPHWLVTRPALSLAVGRMSALRAPTRSERAAAGDAPGGAAARRRISWGVGRRVLRLLLAWAPLRRALYRRVRPVLLAAAVEIERAARPGQGASRHLEAALGTPAGSDPARKQGKVKAPKAPKRPKVASSLAAERSAELSALLGGAGPVVAGPWLGTVGVEVTRWIPFLRWATEQLPDLAERLVAVSRGGVGALYDGVAHRYLDAAELLTLPPGLVDRAALDGGTDASTKEADPIAAELARRAREVLGAQDATLLGVDVLRRLDRKLGDDPAGLPFAASYAVPAGQPNRPGLPRRAVAVRFAGGPAFPATPENRAFAASTVASLLDRGPVFLLADALGVEEALGGREGLVVTGGLRDAGAILRTQLETIRQAAALVGGYDGLTAAAAIGGTPAVGISSAPASLDGRTVSICRALARSRSVPIFGPVGPEEAAAAIAEALGVTERAPVAHLRAVGAGPSSRRESGAGLA